MTDNDRKIMSLFISCYNMMDVIVKGAETDVEWGKEMLKKYESDLLAILKANQQPYGNNKV